jgi:hypothetical protein
LRYHRQTKNSFLKDGDKVHPGAPVPVRGIAFGGDCGVKNVDFSIDGGTNWSGTELGKDEGTYGFRQWRTEVTAPASGDLVLMARCTNTSGVSQPIQPNWNPNGFMRNVIEIVRLAVG